MTLKRLIEPCPVCNLIVYALRITRIYCNDSCKALHHRTTRKQIEDRVFVELMNERDYVKLFSRNLYLIEAVMGPDYDKMSVKLKSFKAQKFQLTECSQKTVINGKTIYTLGNYEYFVSGEILEVQRKSASPEYGDSVVGRWLLSYPDLVDRERYSLGGLANLKKLYLDNGLVWRE